MTDSIYPDLPDAQLLERHLQGDADAFGQLFLRHRDRLWAVALRTLCDPEEAADALQEAMISAFRRAGDFRGDSAVTTWLHRIVVNASLDRLRRRTAHAASSVGDEGTLDLLATQGRVPATTDPASVRDTALDVEAALRLIPPEQRAALVLVDMLGYPVADAAAVLEISVGTVKSRCARGRARLLPYLEHLRGGAAAADHRAERRISRNRTATGQRLTWAGRRRMRRHSAHVDANVLAELSAGLISGRRATRIHAHLAGCQRCAKVSAGLSEVSVLLASVPPPAMPEMVSRRLTAAITEEAAARSGAAGRPAGLAGQQAFQRAGRAHGGPPAERRRGLTSPVAARAFAAAAAVCVVAAGGYTVVRLTAPGGSGPVLHGGNGQHRPPARRHGRPGPLPGRAGAPGKCAAQPGPADVRRGQQRDRLSARDPEHAGRERAEQGQLDQRGFGGRKADPARANGPAGQLCAARHLQREARTGRRGPLSGPPGDRHRPRAEGEPGRPGVGGRPPVLGWHE